MSKVTKRQLNQSSKNMMNTILLSPEIEEAVQDGAGLAMPRDRGIVEKNAE